VIAHRNRQSGTPTGTAVDELPAIQVVALELNKARQLRRPRRGRDGADHGIDELLDRA
jgi:hypothetical protein